MVQGLTRDLSVKKKRANKYIPGLASFKFKPQEYWDPSKAEELYRYNDFSFPETDTIQYTDCIPAMHQMPPESVDLVIADPPFGIEYTGKEGIYNRDDDYVVESYQEINLDYRIFTENWMSSLCKIMKPHATAYIFSGWNHLEDILRGARKGGLTTINHLIWKYQFGVFTKKKYVTSHYHILFLAKNPDAYYFNKMEHYPQDVFNIKRQYMRGEAKNATTLPAELIKKFIENSSRPGDLVFDPFMGMGTTAYVSKSLWRHYFGFEINKKMEAVITSRIDEISPGNDYSPLDNRLKKVYQDAKEKYPLAYRIYCKEKGEEVHAK